MSSLAYNHPMTIGSVDVQSWVFPYLCGYRDKVPFFNPEESLVATKKALVFMQRVHAKGGRILLVNTRPGLSQMVKITAAATGWAYVNEHWIGGLMTNWHQLKYSSHAFHKFHKWITPLMAHTVSFPRFTKAKKRFEGLKPLVRLPDVVVVLQATQTYKHILHEGLSFGVPMVTCVDTYSPMTESHFPIPVNIHNPTFAYFLCKAFMVLFRKKVESKPPQRK